VVANGTVYLSGVDGADPATGLLPETAEDQTRIALEKVTKRLAEAGSDADHIVRFVAFIVGREHIEGYRKAKNEWLKKYYSYPSQIYASLLLLVEGLDNPEMVVEFEITAVVK
jgi:enamine deaminase RidA (YjgF/YER057c/UK114 family)